MALLPLLHMIRDPADVYFLQSVISLPVEFDGVLMKNDLMHF
jgi:hypothetical protein